MKTAGVLASLAGFLTDMLRFGRKRVAMVTGLLAARSLSEGLSFVMLIPLLGFAGVLADGGSGGTLQGLLDGLQNALGFRFTLATALGLFIVLVAIRAGLGAAAEIASARFQSDYADHVRQRLYFALSRASWSYLARSSHARDTHALTMQAEAADVAASTAFRLIAGSLSMAIGIAVALAASMALTVMVLATGLATGALMLCFLGSAYARANSAMEALQRLFEAVQSRMGALKLAKAFSIERELERDFAEGSKAYARANHAARVEQARVNLLQEIGVAVGLAVIIWASVRLANASAVVIVLLILIFARLFPLALGIISGVRGLVGVMPQYVALCALEREARGACEALEETTGPIVLRNRIELERVSYRHPNRESRFTLEDISLIVPAGKAVGVVGLSGAGKTTLADILAGLVEPTSGRVLVDGHAIEGAGRFAWRAHVTYVPQDAPMMHDTVRANLVIGARDADEGRIWRCLELAHARDLVRGLPMGLDTIVGERGARLSGGEAQRLRLASALLREPGVLILDEAMSALNPIDEARLIGSLKSLRDPMTIVIVAHRMSSIAWTDQLVVVENGRIAAVGATRQLLSENIGVHALMRRIDGGAASENRSSRTGTLSP